MLVTEYLRSLDPHSFSARLKQLESSLASPSSVEQRTTSLSAGSSAQSQSELLDSFKNQLDHLRQTATFDPLSAPAPLVAPFTGSALHLLTASLFHQLVAQQQRTPPSPPTSEPSTTKLPTSPAPQPASPDASLSPRKNGDELQGSSSSTKQQQQEYQTDEPDALLVGDECAVGSAPGEHVAYQQLPPPVREEETEGMIVERESVGGGSEEGLHMTVDEERLQDPQAPAISESILRTSVVVSPTPSPAISDLVAPSRAAEQAGSRAGDGGVQAMDVDEEIEGQGQHQLPAQDEQTRPLKAPVPHLASTFTVITTPPTDSTPSLEEQPTEVSGLPLGQPFVESGPAKAARGPEEESREARELTGENAATTEKLEVEDEQLERRNKKGKGAAPQDPFPLSSNTATVPNVDVASPTPASSSSATKESQTASSRKHATSHNTTSSSLSSVAGSSHPKASKSTSKAGSKSTAADDSLPRQWKPLKQSEEDKTKGVAYFHSPTGQRVELNIPTPEQLAQPQTIADLAAEDKTAAINLILKVLKQHDRDGRPHPVLPSATASNAASLLPLGASLNLTLFQRHPSQTLSPATALNASILEGINKLTDYTYLFSLEFDGGTATKAAWMRYCRSPAVVEQARQYSMDVYWLESLASERPEGPYAGWGGGFDWLKASDEDGVGVPPYDRCSDHFKGGKPSGLNSFRLKVVKQFCLAQPQHAQHLHLKLAYLGTAAEVDASLSPEDVMMAEALHAACFRSHVMGGGLNVAECGVKASGNAVVEAVRGRAGSTPMALVTLCPSAEVQRKQKYADCMTVEDVRRSAIIKAKNKPKLEKKTKEGVVSSWAPSVRNPRFTSTQRSTMAQKASPSIAPRLASAVPPPPPPPRSTHPSPTTSPNPLPPSSSTRLAGPQTLQPPPPPSRSAPSPPAPSPPSPPPSSSSHHYPATPSRKRAAESQIESPAAKRPKESMPARKGRLARTEDSDSEADSEKSSSSEEGDSDAGMEDSEESEEDSEEQDSSDEDASSEEEEAEEEEAAPSTSSKTKRRRTTKVGGLTKRGAARQKVEYEPWTPAEESKLRKLWTTDLTLLEIAKQLGRYKADDTSSGSSISAQAMRLGLPKRLKKKLWSSTEVKVLRKAVKEGKQLSAVARLFPGRTKRSVQHKMGRL